MNENFTNSSDSSVGNSYCGATHVKITFMVFHIQPIRWSNTLFFISSQVSCQQSNSFTSAMAGGNMLPIEARLHKQQLRPHPYGYWRMGVGTGKEKKFPHHRYHPTSLNLLQHDYSQLHIPYSFSYRG